VRQAGADFGYEPSAIETPKRRRKLGEPIYGDPEPATTSEAPEADEAPGQENAESPTGLNVSRGSMLSIVGELLTYPIKSGRAAFIVSASALILFVVDYMVKFSFGPALLVGGAALICLILYPKAYLVRVAEAGTQGHKELPGWPDVGETGGLGLRLFLTDAACLFPAIVVFFGLVFQGSAIEYPSIGTKAHMLASGEEPLKGKSAANAEFLDTSGNAISMTGNWSVIALLGRDTGEQVSLADMTENLPSAGMGVTVWHAMQVWDIERVGRACGKGVRVYGAYADPAMKKIHAKYPFTIPTEDEDEDENDYEEDYEDEDEEEELDPFGYKSRDHVLGELDRAMGNAEHGMGVAAGGAVRGQGPLKPDAESYSQSPFKALTLIHTEGFQWPEPLTGTTRFPAVVVVDPKGIVRRQYPTGIYDRQLYADVLDLRAGGTGYARPKTLPLTAMIFVSETEGSSLPPFIGWGLLLVALLAGCFYYPMALLMMVCFTSGAMAFRYPAAIRAIAATWSDYVVVAILFVAVEFGGAIVGNSLEFILRNLLHVPSLVVFIFGDYLQWWITFYGLLVCSYAVGRYYQLNADRLGWFTKPWEQDETAEA
jgi:hypothetical protein